MVHVKVSERDEGVRSPLLAPVRVPEIVLSYLSIAKSVQVPLAFCAAVRFSYLTLYHLHCLPRQSHHDRTNVQQHAFCELQSRFHVSCCASRSTLAYRPRCISVGTRKGYSITNCDPFGRVYTMSVSIMPAAPPVVLTSVRRWSPRDCGDALLHVTHSFGWRSGSATVEPAQATNCKHQSAYPISATWPRMPLVRSSTWPSALRGMVSPLPDKAYHAATLYATISFKNV
jgi:hypothetical protein